MISIDVRSSHCCSSFTCPVAPAAGEVDLGVVLLPLVLRHVVAGLLEARPCTPRTRPRARPRGSPRRSSTARPRASRVRHAVGRREAVRKRRLLGDHRPAHAPQAACASLSPSSSPPQPAARPTTSARSDQSGSRLTHRRPLRPVCTHVLVDDGERGRERVVRDRAERHVLEAREVDVVVDDALVVRTVEAALVAVRARDRDLVERAEHASRRRRCPRASIAAASTLTKSYAYIASSGGWIDVARRRASARRRRSAPKLSSYARRNVSHGLGSDARPSSGPTRTSARPPTRAGRRAAGARAGRRRSAACRRARPSRALRAAVSTAAIVGACAHTSSAVAPARRARSTCGATSTRSRGQPDPRARRPPDSSRTPSRAPPAPSPSVAGVVGEERDLQALRDRGTRRAGTRCRGRSARSRKTFGRASRVDEARRRPGTRSPIGRPASRGDAPRRVDAGALVDDRDARRSRIASRTFCDGALRRERVVRPHDPEVERPVVGHDPARSFADLLRRELGAARDRLADVRRARERRVDDDRQRLGARRSSHRTRTRARPGAPTTATTPRTRMTLDALSSSATGAARPRYAARTRGSRRPRRASLARASTPGRARRRCRRRRGRAGGCARRQGASSPSARRPSKDVSEARDLLRACARSRLVEEENERGRVASAAAIATSWRSAPESSSHGRSAAIAESRPRRARRAASARAAAPARACRGVAKKARAGARRDGRRLHRRRPRRAPSCRERGWSLSVRTIPSLTRSRAGSASSTRSPRRTRPSSGDEAARRASLRAVDFPEPFGPTSAMILPGLEVEVEPRERERARRIA